MRATAIGAAMAAAMTAAMTAMTAASLAASDPPPPAGPAKSQPEISHTFLKVGDEAPDFTLPDTEGQPVTLSSFRGKKDVILAFYVLAFTGG
jgi:cytochrome oxidase Cu insertion factor (SCO1/SenC/PrrC family)